MLTTTVGCFNPCYFNCCVDATIPAMIVLVGYLLDTFICGRELKFPYIVNMRRLKSITSRTSWFVIIMRLSSLMIVSQLQSRNFVHEYIQKPTRISEFQVLTYSRKFGMYGIVYFRPGYLFPR